MTIIKIEEVRQFSEAQLEKGRRDSMAGIDAKLAKQEMRALARSAALSEREERYRASTAVAMEVYLLEKSSKEEASSDTVAQKKSQNLRRLLGHQSDEWEQSL